VHREGVLRDPTGQLGVVVGDEEHERVEASLAGEPGNGREGLLGLALHRGAIGDGDHGYAIPSGELVTEGESLGLGKGRAERAVREQDTLGVDV